MDFSDRLRQRHQLWWTTGVRWHEPHTYRTALHARVERRQRRSRTDSDDTWRCCPLWPRRLLNKWNAREFAVRHGAPVPELYRYCRSARQLPLGSLPDRYVIRPLLGANDAGVIVVVDGRDLLSDDPRPPDSMRDYLSGRTGPTGGPYLVEEFIGREDGGAPLPLEYKCHTFAGRVAAVQVAERRDGRETRRYYRPDWHEFDDAMDVREQPADLVPRPEFLQPMLEVSARIGARIGTYMRIDFLGGDDAWVFNEFSSTPLIKSLPFTPGCNELFGGLWEELCPDAT